MNKYREADIFQNGLNLQKTNRMSLLNQKNNKDKKKGNKKNAANAKDSKFIVKPKAGFISKQANTGSQRGS